MGVLALVAFGWVESRSPHPMLPMTLFRSRQFTAANLVTLLVYAALGGVFFFLVLNLQVVSGFSPMLAGAALLPVTVVMLLLSSRMGSLAQRIGPRWPMTIGPAICALAVLLLAPVGADASYVVDVLPWVTLFGLGLAVTVAPLTATVLASAPDRYAGVASGVNNAVARVGGLLAVAALPLVAGLTGTAYADPDALNSAYRTSMLVCAGLLLAGALVAALTIGQPSRAEVVCRVCCPVGAPPLEPIRR
jgi:predicted MFS family arabinose efflux permease